MYHSGVNSTISVPSKQVSRSHRAAACSSPDIYEDVHEVPSGYCVEPSPRQVVGVSSTAISYKPHKAVSKHRYKDNCPPQYAKPKKKKGLVMFLQNKAKKLRKQSTVLDELRGTNDVECLERQIDQLQCELKDVNGVLHKVIKELLDERQRALELCQDHKPKKKGFGWLCCGNKNDEHDGSDDSDNCEDPCSYPEPQNSMNKACENVSYYTNKSDFASKLFPANQCSSVSQNTCKSHQSNMSSRGRTIKKTVSRTYVDHY